MILAALLILILSFISEIFVPWWSIAGNVSIHERCRDRIQEGPVVVDNAHSRLGYDHAKSFC